MSKGRYSKPLSSVSSLNMFPSLISETVVLIAVFMTVLVQIPLAETVAQMRGSSCVWTHPVGLVSAFTPMPQLGHGRVTFAAAKSIQEHQHLH